MMKINFEKEHKVLANSIALRSKVRLDTSISDMDKETNSFFCWVMSRLLWTIDGCKPPSKYNNIKLVAGYVESCGSVLVEHGKVAQYWSDRNINREDFFKIMKKVANLLNSISGYSTTFLHEEGFNVAVLNVFLDSSV